jgi:drug/metabolite transporter (DMT)-like permease
LASAYKHTRITNLLPYEYVKLVFTAIFAFMLFGEVITITTIIGSAIILTASFYIAGRYVKTDSAPSRHRA